MAGPIRAGSPPARAWASKPAETFAAALSARAGGARPIAAATAPIHSRATCSRSGALNGELIDRFRGGTTIASGLRARPVREERTRGFDPFRRAHAAPLPRVTILAMDARTQSALLAGIVSLALAVAMLLRQGRTRLWTSFALLNF